MPEPLDITVDIPPSLYHPQGEKARFIECPGPDRARAIYPASRPQMEVIDNGERVNCAVFRQDGKTYLRYVNMTDPKMKTIWLVKV